MPGDPRSRYQGVSQTLWAKLVGSSGTDEHDAPAATIDSLLDFGGSGGGNDNRAGARGGVRGSTSGAGGGGFAEGHGRGSSAGIYEVVGCTN